ncbi:hypothetical protein [Pseudomonas sp. CGJS7]|uniref:hypothetical protein n=1 Tax=Pseudomonas sp. CGJS7 TaxID=3109348 RepID=UPI00300BC7B7
MELFDYNRNADADVAAGAFAADRLAEATEVKVLHATFVDDRDPATCVTLIVHSESMEERTIAALHQACLEAVRRVSSRIGTDGDAVG